ncbi:efflux RND transporter periplasmic adaptor subunit [soil metagenome]|jgi:membrane fusion protein (multidrug efflux system)
MKQRYKRGAWVVGSVAVLGALAAPKLISSAGDSPAPAGPSGAPAAVVVATYVASPQPIADVVRTTGTLRANEEVELVAEATGRITQVLFSEGSRVRSGQLLVKINDADLRAQRQSILQRLQLAETGESRRAQLLQIGGVSQEEFDQIRNEVGVLRAEVARIDAQIARTEIRAPFSGTIGLRAVSPGSFLSSQTPVATLSQTDPVKLDFDVPERYAGRVRVGDAVTFRAEGAPGEFRATVYALEPGIASETRTLRVRARGPNPGGVLHPGAFAQVELVLQEIPDALLVPTTALMPSADRTLVYLVRDGKAEPRPVETGIRTADQVQILSGIAPGDSVITSGLQLLRPGAPVRTEAP